MNYQKHYDSLVQRASKRTLEGYVEKHHTIPKCMGGADEISNIVELTAEEHFVAHQLLVKMYPDNRKLVYALILMSGNNGKNKVSNNKAFGWIKRKMATATRERLLGVPLTKEHKQNITNGLLKSIANGTMRTGTPAQVENAKQMGKANKGRKATPEQRAATSANSKGVNNGMYSKEHTTEAKAKMSHYAKNRTSEHRNKLSVSQTGKTQSEEQKSRRSKSQKEVMANMSDEKKRLRGAKISKTLKARHKRLKQQESCMAP